MDVAHAAIHWQKITVEKSKKKKLAEDVEAKKEDLEKPVEQATG